MIAEVLQYLRPHGKRYTNHIEISEDYSLQYELIHACGCMLTCEQLMSGKAVQYISNENGDFAIEITAAGNEEAAFKALLKMIREFDKDAFEKWNKQFEKENDGT